LNRAVARQAMADRLPPSIAGRHERGAQLPDWLDRMTDARNEITTELAAARDHPTSRALIDVERLDALVRQWPDRDRAADRTTAEEYRLALLRALVLSKYIRWFEDRAHRHRIATPADSDMEYG
jgi:hypothetical protein